MPIEDRNDFKPWSERDIADIDDALARGLSAEEVAEFLCRSGTVEDVAEKMEQRRAIIARAKRD